MKNELTEARHIILALAGIRDRLKECDVRFLESWQSYLQNAPEPTIGRWRLHNLRTLADTYGLRSGDLALSDKPDLSVVAAD